MCKHENLIVMGDFNINIKNVNSDKDKQENFCDLFNLANLVHLEIVKEKHEDSSL